MNSSILYVHCNAYCLNLALVALCGTHKDNPLIFDFFGGVQFVYNFVEGSPVRHAVLEDIASKTEAQLRALKSLSNTRWACRAEAVSTIKEHFDTIISAIENIINVTNDSLTRTKGRGLLTQLKSFSFIVSLEIMEPILQLTLNTSKQLQSKSLNLYEVMVGVQSLLTTLKTYRSDGDVFDSIYSKAVEKCKKLGIEIPEPRKRKIPRKIDYSPTIENLNLTKKEEIKIYTFYPVLDAFILTLNDKFSQETTSLIQAVGKCIVPLKVTTCKQFNLNFSELRAEIELLKSRTKELNRIPSNLFEWLNWVGENDRKNTYHNLWLLMRKFSIIPITSCSCERSFSKLVSVKTTLRSTIKQDRLSSLMLLFIEQSKAKEIEVRDVIDELKKIVPYERRMVL